MINQQKPPVGSKTPTWPTLHRVSANFSNQLEIKETFERFLTMIWTINKANVLLCQVVTEQKNTNEVKSTRSYWLYSHGLGFCCCCCWTFELVGMTLGLGYIIFWSDGFQRTQVCARLPLWPSHTLHILLYISCITLYIISNIISRIISYTTPYITS